MARLKLVFAILFVKIFVACNSASTSNAKNADDECNLSQDIIDDIAGYADKVNRIIDHFLQGPSKGETYKRCLYKSIDYFLFGMRIY